MNDSRLGEEAHAEEIARLAVDTDGVNLGEHIEEAIEVIEAEEAGDAEILGRRGDGNPTTVILGEAGERDAERLRKAGLAVLESEPLVKSVDYFSVADAAALNEMDVVDRPAMVSTAVRIGTTRLIDNVLLGD